MADGSKIEWTEATWNPTTGCDRVSVGCDNCLAPESRVLMADGSWRRMEDIAVGDVLLAYDESPPTGANRLLRLSTVKAVWRTTAPTVTITTRSGRTVTCSDHHLWLSRVRPAFRRAEHLGLSSKLCALGDPATAADVADPDYRAGYLAGATAGDGTMRWDPAGRDSRQCYWRVAVLSTDHPILDRLVECLQEAGVRGSAVRSFVNAGYGKNASKAMAKVEHRAWADLAVIAGLLQERPCLAWKAGWLAGFLDTDGSCDGKSVRWSQVKKNDYLDRVVRYAYDLGFVVKIEARSGVRATTARLYVRNLDERVSFLGTIRPALPRKALHPYLGRRFETTDDPVVAVARGPVRELVDITTSTRTFVAEGLATHNCYALTLAKRLKAMGTAKYQNDGDPRTSGPGFGVAVHPDALLVPYRWKQPRVVFVNSMSDLFHARVPLSYVRQVFAVMADTPQHTYQVLTKRAARLRKVAGSLDWPGNLWMGVSVENAAAVGRIADLREVPASVRFLSCEPLLGPLPALDLAGIGWVIAGGESGPRHRAMDPAWAAGVRDQCTSAGVPFFFKQWGGRTPKAAGRLLDGAVWDEMPVAGPPV